MQMGHKKGKWLSSVAGSIRLDGWKRITIIRFTNQT